MKCYYKKNWLLILYSILFGFNFKSKLPSKKKKKIKGSIQKPSFQNVLITTCLKFSAFNFQPKPRRSNWGRLRDLASVQGSDPRAGSTDQRDHSGEHLPAAGAGLGEAAG